VNVPAERKENNGTALNRYSLRGNRGVPGAELYSPVDWRKVKTASVTNDDTPQTHELAMESKDAEKWEAAEREELNALTSMGTYKVVKYSGQKLLRTKWVYSIKRNELGEITKFKARLVACGYAQQYLEDYFQTKADVAPTRSFRLLLALAAMGRMELLQVDVATAYLNGSLKEEIYVRAPTGETSSVWQLLKPLYGLKQAGHNWREEIDVTLRSLGLQPTDADPGFYFLHKDSDVLYLAIHVDDMLVATSTDKLRTWFASKLEEKYKLKLEFRPRWLLHMAISTGNGASWLKIDQGTYIEERLRRFGLDGCRTTRAPIPANVYLKSATDEEQREMTPERVALYQQLVGSIMYASTHTRPDISFVAAHLGKFMHCPGPRHLDAARQVFRYLAGTRSYGPKYTTLSGGEPILVGYSDANFANDEDRHSVGAYCYTVNGGMVSWASHRIKHVCLSTEEAELTAAGEAAREGLALRSILVQIGVLDDSEPVTLFVDNKAAVTVATNPGYYNRLKHVEIQNKFICEAVANGKINVQWCEGDFMLADALTKPLGGPMLERFRKKVLTE
jgi:hypothetical protein